MAISEVKNHAEAFHSGEVYNLWSYLYDTKAYTVTLQILINHTEDEALGDFLDDLLENGVEEEEQQVEAILKEAGIRLPPAPPNRPNVEVQDIPAGARFHDPEIAHFVHKELMAGKLMCTYMMGISVQEDIRTLFSEFHTQKAESDLKLATISKEKGWIVPPPINIK